MGGLSLDEADDLAPSSTLRSFIFEEISFSMGSEDSDSTLVSLVSDVCFFVPGTSGSDVASGVYLLLD